MSANVDIAGSGGACFSKLTCLALRGGLGHGGRFMAARNLPIYEVEERLVQTVRKSHRFILQAPTGSGKSTQVPQILLDRGLLGEGRVVVLQPRRLATRMLAARVARERNGRLGDEVGYQIRFDDVSGPSTRIKYVTEGILLRWMMDRPRLDGVSAILFDEFHERHLYGDISLARALQTQEKERPDLILGVMSATLELGALEKYLSPCEVLESAGRMHPVSVEYLPQSSDNDEMPPWELAARELERVSANGLRGDVLIFMPGAYEINRTLLAVQNLRGARDWTLLPLHGDLPPAQQDLAVAACDKPKVIVSTNVAETSLTIDGVTLVIDSGLARVARFDPHRGINTLLIEKICRASADQRMGRAGRTAPGHCVRLWSEQEHAFRPAQDLPEIKRLDLAEVVLALKAGGVEDLKTFRWLEPPEPKALARAETLLQDLGALGEDGRMTPAGRRMLPFPMHPRYSRMLLAAGELGCVRTAALIAALTQGRNLLLRCEGRQMDELREDILGRSDSSDFFRLIRAWLYADRCNYDFQKCKRLGIHVTTARQVKPLFDAFLRLAQGEGLKIEGQAAEDEAVARCVLAGFADQLAMRCDTGTLRCRILHGRSGVLARESVVQKAHLLVAAEINEVEGRGGQDLNVLLNLATAVKEEWLRELYPDEFKEIKQVMFDPSSKRVVCQVERRFRDLTLETKKTEQVPLDEAAHLLAEEVLQGRCVLKQWDDAVEQWILRVNRLAGWMPELEIPRIGDEDRRALVEQICHGAGGYKDIKDKPVWGVVKGWLSAQQQAWVEQYAPERMTLPNGRKVKVTYSATQPPVVGARIQDLYGVGGSLYVADRRVVVTIQVLAPSFRPLQVTQSLEVFWRESYPRIKQELQRKYPRHEWR
ncbi:MAG: ATP-dependent helicase HrpB [Verrucomicrobiae bacterium]|nr:ATP-dependent helicase HrpB [Verrucomicrobiae bacterium]